MAEQRRSNSIYFVYLLLNLLQQYQQLPNKPPVTISLALILIAIYILEDWFPYMLQSWCMCPFYIISSHKFSDILRIVKSAFIHYDDYHLYYNISSLLWKGSILEMATGSSSFVIMTIFLIISSGSIFIVLSSLFNYFNFSSSSFYNQTAGFSGVLFGYKVISHYYHVAPTSIAGIPMIPSSITWIELFYCSLFPNVSFLGHLSGIFAGYLYIYLPTIVKKLSNVNLKWFASYEGIHAPKPKEKPKTQTRRDYEFTEEDYNRLNEELRKQQEEEIRRRRLEHIQQSRHF